MDTIEKLLKTIDKQGFTCYFFGCMVRNDVVEVTSSMTFDPETLNNLSVVLAEIMKKRPVFETACRQALASLDQKNDTF